MTQKRNINLCAVSDKALPVTTQIYGSPLDGIQILKQWAFREDYGIVECFMYDPEGIQPFRVFRLDVHRQLEEVKL